MSALYLSLLVELSTNVSVPFTILMCCSFLCSTFVRFLQTDVSILYIKWSVDCIVIHHPILRVI